MPWQNEPLSNTLNLNFHICTSCSFSLWYSGLVWFAALNHFEDVFHLDKAIYKPGLVVYTIPACIFHPATVYRTVSVASLHSLNLENKA